MAFPLKHMADTEELPSELAANSFGTSEVFAGVGDSVYSLSLWDVC